MRWPVQHGAFVFNVKCKRNSNVPTASMKQAEQFLNAHKLRKITRPLRQSGKLALYS